MQIPRKSFVCFLFFVYLISSSHIFLVKIVADGVTPEEAKQLRDEVREMFFHAFDGYMKHAFPLDELRPLSCQGEDSLGGYALTLIDSLDTLVLLGDQERFSASVEWIGKNLQFDINKTVSVFETTIRILGGLLSAHLIASDYATPNTGNNAYTFLEFNTEGEEEDFDYPQFHELSQSIRSSIWPTLSDSVVADTSSECGGPTTSPMRCRSPPPEAARRRGMRIPSYDNELLNLAEDLARRLLPAFDTPTGIPFGSVNLMHGVDEDESKAKLLSSQCLFLENYGFIKAPKVLITSTAGGGTLTLEFGVLSRLTKDPVFEEVAKNAVRGLWARRSKLNLVGAHINVFTGEWTQKDAGIGTSIDSFYEYLLKAYLLFGDEEYLFIFQEAYSAAMHYLFNDPWYVEVNMNSAAIVWPLFNSLQAFWPGLQVLAGDIDPAIRTHAAFFSVWKKYGFTPEGFNLATLSVQYGQKSYPLRPELIESTYWLYKATRDPRYLNAGRDMVASLQYGARCPCGYCHIVDVESHKQEDHMESFFLAETVKYLWLLFDLAAGPDNLVENGPYKYIFSTEGHLLPATPQIALAHEHCSYFGAYCQSGDLTESRKLGIPTDSQETNSSQFYQGWRKTSSPSHSTYHKSISTSGGVCPGLTHGQKFGLSYLATTNTMHDDDPATQKEASVSQSHSVVVISKPNAESLSLDDKNVTGQAQESIQEALETKSDDENNDKDSICELL
ncbi:Glycoside hydrolase family 47 [Dillenia turbinata]|uniref:alpha-1,2-Mannosidase n=1 Tax=Dillenia turbinata TaxID=194707 RepID=A0AAN8UNX8_9MAGN